MSVKTELTKEQREAYIKSGYSKCPSCRSCDIEGGSIDVDAGHCWQPVFCHECHLEWNDIYTLSNIEVTNG